MYERKDGKCWAASCGKDATHTVTMRIVATEGLEEWISEVRYCLSCALYFAAWLPYCYPGEQELISIAPPASELFSKD